MITKVILHQKVTDNTSAEIGCQLFEEGDKPLPFLPFCKIDKEAMLLTLVTANQTFMLSELENERLLSIQAKRDGKYIWIYAMEYNMDMLEVVEAE